MKTRQEVPVAPKGIKSFNKLTNRLGLIKPNQVWRFPKKEDIDRISNKKSSISVQNDKSDEKDSFEKDHKSLFNQTNGKKDSISIYFWKAILLRNGIFIKMRILKIFV